MSHIAIHNATIVYPNGVQENGSIRVNEGKIDAISHTESFEAERTVDAQCALLMPGMIDLHNDNIEREIEPRPNVQFPDWMIFPEISKRLASNGITTIYQSLSFGNKNQGYRNPEFVAELIRKIIANKAHLQIDTKIHLRYELSNNTAVQLLEELIDENMVDFCSLMDHTLGQGQYVNDPDSLARYYRDIEKMSEEKVQEIMASFGNTNTKTIEETANKIITLCRKHNIPMASHDDDTIEKIEEHKKNGIILSEFPTNIETAKAATESGIYSMVGSSNILRDKSSGGNLRGRVAVKEKAAQVICSDYAPSSMIYALFELVNNELAPLHEACNMVSLNPAKAAGIDQHKGSIEVGKDADLMIVHLNNNKPIIKSVFCKGKRVFEQEL